MYKGLWVYLYIMGDISNDIIDIYAKIGAPLQQQLGFFWRVWRIH